MTEIPAENYTQPWATGDRTSPPLVGDERETLTAFLDRHRQTFELECSGIPPERLSERCIAPSRLSLHGLLRHLAGIAEYARHNGHADLLRERIDGATGY